MLKVERNKDPDFVYSTILVGSDKKLHTILYGADNDDEAILSVREYASLIDDESISSGYTILKTTKLEKRKLFPRECLIMENPKERFIHNTMLLLDTVNPTKQEKRTVEKLLSKLRNGVKA